MTHLRTNSEARDSRFDHGRMALAGLFAMTVFAGCSANRPPSVLDEVPVTTRHARMMVRNQHRHEVRVVVIPHADAFELGSVGPTSSKAFRLPQQLNGMPARVQLRCMVTNELHTSHELTWDGEQVLDLEIQPMLNLSTVALRR